MRRLLPLAALTLLLAAPAGAQQASINGDLHADIAEVQKKIIDLARAIPESAYDWRPGAGVRSVREVFLHLASDNYLMPAFLGAPAPEATGVTTDYATAVKFEKRAVAKAQVVADLEASFAHVHRALAATVNDQNMGQKVTMFGQEFTRQRAALVLTTHLHEHLGQLIAYARSNNVVPPWSR